MTTRTWRGFALTELVVAVAIAGLLSALLLGAMAAQVRLARAAADRSAERETIRTAAHVLSGEAARITARDVRALAADSLGLRAFRAAGVACRSEDGVLRVRFRGDRLPDPRKDSVLVIDGDGRERAFAFIDARVAATEGCAPAAGEAVQLWTLSEDAPAAALVLLFESGSFYISGSALRYRLGGEGRQPLTAELLRPPSGFEGSVGGTLRFTLATQAGLARFSVPLAGARRP